MEQPPKTSNPIIKLWINAILFGFFVLLLCSLYQFVRAGEFNLRIFNQSIADAGMIVIGVSFALSGLTYFWDFLDSKLKYRKYIGLVGFYLILMHGLISLFGLSDNFPFPEYYLLSHNITAFLLALGSLLYLIFMAIISNSSVAQKLGGILWRKLLRVGYLAYLLGFLHYASKKYVGWQYWLTSEGKLLPPLSLIVTLFVIWVFALRLALWWDLRRKKHIQT